MRLLRVVLMPFLWLLVIASAIWVVPMAVQAESNRLIVSPDGPYQTIEAALLDALPGDTIEVHGGTYSAPLVIEKSLTLVGIDNPVIDGKGTGSLVVIVAPNSRFEGFTIRNSGTSIDHEDTGIVIQAQNVRVADNTIENVLFGIYFADAESGIAQNNTIQCYDRDMGIRGDGIRVWFSSDVLLRGNDVTNCRDTLIWYAQNIIIEENTFRDSRYGLHFMYSSNATISTNTFERNSVGSYLMYSQHLTMTDNRMIGNRGPSGYGIALKDIDYATVTGNIITGNRSGMYIDNSPALYDVTNTTTDNLIAYNDIGISALPSTTRNIFQSNIFLENNQQISVLGRGNLLNNTWHFDGTGNYWSDYAGYDGDGDAIGDMPYRAEKLFESLTDEYASLRLFNYSPASQAIEFAASAFPSLRPDPKVIDEAPMMRYGLPPGMLQDGQTVSVPFLAISILLLGIGMTISLFALRKHLLHRRRGSIGNLKPAQASS